MYVNNHLDLSLFKTSSVGTTVDSPESDLDVNMEYSGVGWFFITIMGTSQNPIRIEFKCLKTGEIFETLTDKELIKHYMTYRRV
tara:strand:- start:342962 stop:343213 length:252 start_codon:yes stop_codon:yes gene_type:complete